MSLPLLATKLYIPPARAELVARPRLTEKLRAALERPGCLTLLSGPAGSGKTTLLSEFIAGCGLPVGWLSLDESDNDPARFWSYLIAACRAARPGVGEAAQALLNAPSPEPLPADTLPTLLINDLVDQAAPLALVLDDFHRIQNPAVLAGCLFLVEHLPDCLQLIVATRSDPPLPLARFRARNRLVEIRAQDLRFTQVETAEFLNRSMGLGLSAEDIAALDERTEGWAAGLQLAGLAIQGTLSAQGREDVERFVQAFTGSHIYVAEYLVEEVLKHQPEEMQAFLLQTSILGRMNAELCEAVCSQPVDGQARLTALHKANLFLIPLDDEAAGAGSGSRAGWFRYHHLFADLLRAHLPRVMSAQAIADLHARASQWYERSGFAPEAVEHALAARDYPRAAGLVEQAARTLIFSAQLSLLRGWLDAIPGSVFSTRPLLAIFRLYLDMIQGRLDVTPQALREKEQLIRSIPPTPENMPLRLELLTFLCRFMAFLDLGRAIQTAEETLAEVPEENARLRAHLYSALCIAYGMEGNAAKAETTYRECSRLALASRHYSLLSHTTMIVAQGMYYFARLHEAAGYCRTVIELARQPGMLAPGQKDFYPAGHGYIGLASVLLEWNRLDEAEAALRQGIELCRLGGFDGVFTGHALQARLKQARGDLPGALAELDYLDQNFQRKDYTVMARRVLVELAMGIPDAPARWEQALLAMINASTAAGTRMPWMVVEAFQALMARVLLARGKLTQAGQVLDALQASAEQSGRSGRLIEVYLLRARAAVLHEDTTQALTHLARALALAEPEQIVLIFLEEGDWLVPLLEALVSIPYAQSILCGYAKHNQKSGTAPAPTASVVLVEPLTEREMEVLQRIAAGDSNQAIANRLVITVRTVKKHTGNIFGKLDVSSRTQAVARARELGLLEGNGS